MAKNICPHNDGVRCPEDGRHCRTCGWFPDVDKRRRVQRTKRGCPPTQQPPERKRGRSRQVAKIDEAGNVLECYPSLVMAAAVNGLNPSSIKYHCQGTLRHPFKCTGGFSFRYAD